MKSLGWKDTVEFVGIAAIVASLVFVGLQLKQAQSIATSEMASKLLVDQMEWINLKNTNRDVWVRGNRGDELSEIEMSAYRDLVATRDAMAFFQYRQLQRLGTTGEIPMADFATYLHQNPGARREWERRSDEFEKYRPSLLNEELSEAITKSDQAYDSQLQAKIDELDRLYGRKSIGDSADRE